MKHIETTCEEEKKARKEFSRVDTAAAPVVATEDQKEKIMKLLELRHKMDVDALTASRMKAEIMNMMKTSDSIVDADGRLLVSWGAGNAKKVVDYARLFKKFGISDRDVAGFTSTKVGARVFSIELD